jgi:serine/threonine protein kinase
MSSMKIVKLTTTTGQPVEYIDEMIGQGGMKDVYFSPKKDYVIAFFRSKPDSLLLDRLTMISETYRKRIFDQDGGDYWRQVFCWPTGMVVDGDRVGVVVPTYDKTFFFEHGSRNNDMLKIKGKEKEGKWFASANNRNRFIDPIELGDWSTHLRMCIQLARATRRMHNAGLSHSDLSYKNCLVDPKNGRACLIDLDGLVVPGRYPPDVVGTPDFIAPECVATAHLNRNDPNRKLPSIATDQHALAVLIYMYLLYRHPLRGKKLHDASDPQKDDALLMGKGALFIEHPTDGSNRINVKNVRPSELPWADTIKVPYTITGPYLSELFKRAFIDGLHEPSRRPTAQEWEDALVKTVDLIQPCLNSKCDQKWYVFDNSTKPVCPYCGTPHKGKLPVLNLYSSRTAGRFMPDNHRVMVYTNQSFFSWHANRLISPNEKLKQSDKKRIAYFVNHAGAWWLVNEAMTDLTDKSDPNQDRVIAVGEKIELKDGQKLLLSKEMGGRVVVVQMVDS